MIYQQHYANFASYANEEHAQLAECILMAGDLNSDILCSSNESDLSDSSASLRLVRALSLVPLIFRYLSYLVHGTPVITSGTAGVCAGVRANVWTIQCVAVCLFGRLHYASQPWSYRIKLQSCTRVCCWLDCTRHSSLTTPACCSTKGASRPVPVGITAALITG